MQKPAFGGRHQPDRSCRPDHVAPQREAQNRTEPEAGKQDTVLGRDGDSMDSGPVNQREKNERVIRALLALEVFDHSRCRRPELADPFHFLGS